MAGITYAAMRSCVGGAWAIMSEPRNRKGSARCWILFGGPTLARVIEWRIPAVVYMTHPKLLNERRRSGAKGSCSHFEITGPPSLVEAVETVSIVCAGNADEQHYYA